MALAFQNNKIRATKVFGPTTFLDSPDNFFLDKIEAVAYWQKWMAHQPVVDKENNANIFVTIRLNTNTNI